MSLHARQLKKTKPSICTSEEETGKDGLEHSFDLCEECYDKLIKGFAVPVNEEEITELL